RIYSLMIITGLLICIFMAGRKMVKMGYKKEYLENMIIVVFIAALIGARIYYVIFSWEYYKDNPLEIFAVWHGGLAIHGGVIMGFIAALIYSHYLKIKVMLFGDLIAPWLILGQGLGRLGNFANGEAHGVPVITPPEIIFRLKPVFTDFWTSALYTFNLNSTPENVSKLNEIAKNGAEVTFQGKVYELKEYVPWGISFTDKYMPAAYRDFGTLAVHPTFFYEMILNVTAAAIMYYFWRNSKNISTGLIFGIYLVSYGLIRGFVTMFRADDLMLGFIRAPHVASLAFIFIGIFLIIRAKKILKEYVK
ncbi:MAG: prolipoprotein diacylglyceryl transferase, partial [Mucispirillum sp.]|nr:prolipoprotein diacylglyceryl transferase [Mucispirillum sp.]